VLALTAVLALTDDVEAMTYDASANRVSAFFFFFGLMAGGTNTVRPLLCWSVWIRFYKVPSYL